MAEYLDFELSLEKLSEGYRAKVVRSALSEHPEKFFSISQLLTHGSPQEIGASLHDSIFSGEVGNCWHKNLIQAKSEDKRLRLLLRFQIEAYELTAFQWELLYSQSGNNFFALSSETPILRYLELAQGHFIRSLKVTLPLRILVVLSSPSNYPTLQIEKEWSSLQQAMKPLQSKVVLERLEKPSIDTLRTRLRKNDVNILHFVGHGDFDYKKQEGKLYFENEDKRSSSVSAEEFATNLHDCNALRFVFLSACESAAVGSATSFAGVAQKLVQAGVPAVLAMQANIEDSIAIKFTSEFYESLLNGFPIDACVAEARKAIYKSSQDNPAWAIPVLFMHTTDGQLFSLADKNLPLTSEVEFYDRSYQALPERYIERGQLLASAKRELLSSTTGLAVVGMGGSGKSVLARAICNDLDIRRAFPDGILWATLGQNPNLGEKLREWVVALKGIISESAPTLNTLTYYLKEQLKNRSCLLVLDDIWTAKDTEVFRVNAPNCRLLITTRKTSLAHQVDVRVMPVEVMSEDESLNLLERCAGTESLHDFRDRAKKIVKMLGYLPLAIELAGAKVRRDGVESWLNAYQGIRELQNRHINPPHDSLEATFDLSVQDLSEDERKLYFSLAVFREDEAIPIDGINALWSTLGTLSTYQAENFLNVLYELSLIRLSRYEDSITYTIHDLLGEFIGLRLGEEGRLHAHSALLAAYRKQQQGHGWHTVPADGYFYPHLVYHLDALSAHDPKAETELVDLFATSDWLQARVNSSEQTYGGYISDLEIAWKRRHETALRLIDQGQVPDAIADCFQFALIHSALAALSANYEPYMIAAAVRTGLWSQSLALSLVQLQPDHRKRIRAAQALRDTNELSESSSQSAWEICEKSSIAICTEWQTEYPFQRQTNSDGKSLEEDVSFISKYLSAPSFTDLVSKTIKMALTYYSSPQDGRVHAFCVLAPFLNLTQAEEALELVKEDSWRIDAITALLPRLTVERQLVALRIIFDDVKNFGHSEVLFKSLAYMNSELLSEMLTLISTFDYEEAISNGLIQLAPFLKGDSFQKAIYIADTIPNQAQNKYLSFRSEDDTTNNEHRNMALFVYAAIAQLHHSDTQVMSSESITQKLGEYWQDRTFFLQYVNHKNIDSLVSKAIECLSWYEEVFDYLIVNSGNTYVHDDIFEYALHHHRWDSLGAIIPKLTIKQRSTLQEKFLMELRDKWYLHVNQDRTVASILSMYNDMVLRDIVTNLLEYGLSPYESRSPILIGLAPFLDSEQIYRVFEEVRGLNKLKERLPLLKVYLPYIEERFRQQYISEILDDLEESSGPDHVKEKICLIAPFLSDEQWVRTKARIDTLDSTSYGHTKAQSLLTLFQNVSKQILRSELAEFGSLSKVEEEYLRSKESTLIFLAPTEFYRKKLSPFTTKLLFLLVEGRYYRLIVLGGRYDLRAKTRSKEGIITIWDVLGAVVISWYVFLRFKLARKIERILFFLLRPVILIIIKIFMRNIEITIRNSLTHAVSDESYESSQGSRDLFNRIQVGGLLVDTKFLAQILELIRQKPNELRRSYYLHALAPCLLGSVRKTALEMVSTLSDLRVRLSARSEYLQTNLNDKLLLIQLRRDILEVLATELKGQPLKNVLDFCSREDFLGDPILSKHVRQRIGGHIREILEEWKWN